MLAHELNENSGSPSMMGVTQLAENGNIVGLPSLASIDIHEA
jgi:hypothetical protein